MGGRGEKQLQIRKAVGRRTFKVDVEEGEQKIVSCRISCRK